MRQKHEHEPFTLQYGEGLGYVACWGCPARSWTQYGEPCPEALAHRVLGDRSRRTYTFSTSRRPRS